MPDDLLILGQTNYRNDYRRFGLKAPDRRRPVLILGKTGMGKSTLLFNCIVQDIRAGRGVAVVDPHGDLVEQVLHHIPSWRINETMYFNPADTDYPVGFNVLAHSPEHMRPLVASGLIQVFRKVWGDFWGPRLEYVLRHALLALLEQPGQTLLGVPRLLTDDRFRERVIAGVTDPLVRRFWTHEFSQYPKGFRTETISPIQNKVGQFLTNPILRNILGQPRNRLDLRRMMDGQQILLANLSKGLLGEDSASLLGALLMTQLHLAALRRAAVSEFARPDFFAYVDEAHLVATEDFAAILSEARKYRLNIAGVAIQYLSQFSPQVQSAILGNFGTLICFAVGSQDARLLAAEFFPTFAAADLQNLPHYEMYLRLSIDGRTSAPFSAYTLPPAPRTHPSTRDRIVAQSRQRYCLPAATVRANHLRWLRQ